MKTLPDRSLRRALLMPLMAVFTAAVLIAGGGAVLLLPALLSPAVGLAFLAALIVADLVIFFAFGRALIERRLLAPLQETIAGVEAIAAGDYAFRLPAQDSDELARLSNAVNTLAERLISHREALEANIRSLEETNAELTGAEDAVVRAEKLASVGRLAAGLAHEVGNPLAAILGYLGLVGRGLDADRRQLIESAESEARRIDRIINGLLDYARVREARPQPIDVNTVVHQSVELIRTQGRFAGIDVQLSLGEELPMVVADAHQLQQVLVNLLVNATDVLADRPAPRIVLETTLRSQQAAPPMPARRRDDPPGIDYSHRRRRGVAGRLPREGMFLPPGEVVEILVADNGPGIPPALVGDVFEPFVTTKEPGKGTGLGLAVSARLVDGMGGTIVADTRPRSHGAAFRVLLPAVTADAAAVS